MGFMGEVFDMCTNQTLWLLLLLIAAASGCNPASEHINAQKPRVTTSVGTSAATYRRRPKPPQFPTTPSAPSLYLLGSWQSLAGAEFDVAFTGNEAGLVAGATMAGADCVYQSQLSTQTMRLFRCSSPTLDDATETRSEPLKVAYNSGALPTYAGPFVFRNAASWKQYNGDFYFASVRQYVINASGSFGPTIALQARALPGYVGDPTFSDYANYFNAIRLNGSGITVTCPTIGLYEYKCPAIPEGIYSIEILREQSRLYVVDNTFIIKIKYGPADTPAPETGTTPTPEDPTTPQVPYCDPSAVKGC